MTPRIVYAPSTGGEIALDGPGAMIDPTALRSREWSYALGDRSVASASRGAREAKVTASFFGAEAADALRRAADRDMAARSPGEIRVGEWSQRCLIAACEVGAVLGGWHEAELTLLLLDGAWRRERTAQLRRDDEGGGEWLDYPHDYGHDYAGAQSSTTLVNESASPSPVKLTVYGPATDPTVTIGGNRYSFRAEVPAGCLLVADGASMPKTIKLVGEYGDVTDAFACGERGLGEGSGSYCFEPLPPGASEATWPGGYGIDVAWYEEEGEPPWTL